jgi:hypothetical protein
MEKKSQMRWRPGNIIAVRATNWKKI